MLKLAGVGRSQDARLKPHWHTTGDVVRLHGGMLLVPPRMRHSFEEGLLAVVLRSIAIG